MNSRVIVAGTPSSMMHEFLKNIVLVGVCNLIFWDMDPETPVRPSDHSNAAFLFQDYDEEDGTPLKALETRLKEWNPNLQVWWKKSSDNGDELLLQSATLLLVFGGSQTWPGWDKRCNEIGLKWMALDSHGLFASMFVNGQEHELFRSETVENAEKAADEEPVKTLVPHTLSYPKNGLDSFLAMPDMSGISNKRARSRISSEAFLLLKCMWNLDAEVKAEEEEEEEGKVVSGIVARLIEQTANPDFLGGAEEGELLMMMKKKKLETLVLQNYKRDVHAIGSIMGGLIAQESIKIISLKEDPVSNWFIMDGRDSTGNIFTTN